MSVQPVNLSPHDEIKRKNKRFAICVSILIVLFTVARMFLTRFFIDPQVHFYTDSASIYGKYFDYTVAACVIAIYCVSFFLYTQKKDKKKYEEATDCFVQGTQAQVFSASLTGFLFIASAVFQIYSFINPIESAVAKNGVLLKDFSFGSERLLEYIKAYPFDFAIFFVAVLSAVYFFKTAALNLDIGENIEHYNKGDKKKRYSSLHIIFSFMPIIWAFLNTFECFFDMSKSVNSPVRIYELISFIALAHYFVSESRMLVGRLETSKFFTFAYIASLITAASSFPNLIWSSFWILAPHNDLIIYAVKLALTIYVLTRIYSQIRYSRFKLQP